jgi:chemotaxis protein CheD
MNETTTIDLYPGGVQAARPPIRLHAPGLGSCVAVVLYDGVEQIGGMAHVMLPSIDHYLKGEDPLKYADEAIPYLMKLMMDTGANRYCLRARLVGGAMVTEDVLDIGSMVQQSVDQILEKHGIEVSARRVGGHEVRSATLDIATGVVWYTENNGAENAL